jgi:hypothetical protein
VWAVPFTPDTAVLAMLACEAIFSRAPFLWSGNDMMLLKTHIYL